MLPLLFSLQVETSKTTKVLLTDCLVHGGSSSNSLSVIVSCVGPPVCLGLDVTEDHVLNWNRETRHLSGHVHDRVIYVTLYVCIHALIYTMYIHYTFSECSIV